MLETKVLKEDLNLINKADDDGIEIDEDGDDIEKGDESEDEDEEKTSEEPE